MRVKLSHFRESCPPGSAGVPPANAGEAGIIGMLEFCGFAHVSFAAVAGGTPALPGEASDAFPAEALRESALPARPRFTGNVV